MRVPGNVMAVVVMMTIDRQGARRLGTKQAYVSGMLRDGVGHARAADVPIETDDPIALRHNDMQIVRDKQHTEAVIIAQTPDQIVKLGFPSVVDALHRLI